MTVRILSTLFVLALVGPLRAQDDKSVAVVKKAIEAHGGAEALNKSKIARSSAKGTMYPAGREMAFTATAAYSVPDRYKMDIVGELNNMKIQLTQVMNGKKSKVTFKSGGTDQPIDAKAKEETAQAGLLQEISTLTPLLEAKKYALKADAEADLNGNKAAVVVVSGNGLRDVKLFFDEKTGRLVKTQRKALTAGAAGTVEVSEETYLSDFKVFGGVTAPTAVLVNHDGKKFMTMTVAELTFVPKIDDVEFKLDD